MDEWLIHSLEVELKFIKQAVFPTSYPCPLFKTYRRDEIRYIVGLSSFLAQRQSPSPLAPRHWDLFSMFTLAWEWLRVVPVWRTELLAVRLVGWVERSVLPVLPRQPGDLRQRLGSDNLAALLYELADGTLKSSPSQLFHPFNILNI